MLELLQTRVGRVVHTGDELELRLAEIGSDVRVRERRAERRRMRRRGERPVGPNAQAFLFDPPLKAREDRGLERANSYLHIIHGVWHRGENCGIRQSDDVGRLSMAT